MTVLVTGGAGYIGSHTVIELIDLGYDVLTVDNFQKGHKQALLGSKFVQADLRDIDRVDEIFKKNNIEAVIHFAADSLVGESMQNPNKYFINNVISGLNILTVMLKYKVDKIIFSSTAAVYGEPQQIPIQENNLTVPTNPYGESKLIFEKMLFWYEKAYNLKYISLRYFNASGAHKSGKIGEHHNPETHLIPIVLECALGKRDCVEIYGDDYKTFDGTCIRDYIHVSDLAMAHILALKKLYQKDSKSAIYNLGNGSGFSVKQIIKVSEEVTGRKIKTIPAKRRSGDPAVLIASSDKIKKELDWQPKYEDIYTIISTAWAWHKSHPDGFKE